MRALLVDDDELLRRALRRSLNGSDIELDEARGVKSALEALKATDYDLIVSDEQMLDGCGHELLAEAAKVRPHCRRALMSGREAPVTAHVTWEKFFAKPNDMSALLRWMNELAAEGPRSHARASQPGLATATASSTATGTRR